MLKSGNWVFGMENEEVQGGSRWIVNIMSLAHGWCCWVETSGNDKNKLKGEVMVSDHQAEAGRAAADRQHALQGAARIRLEMLRQQEKMPTSRSEL